MLECNDGEHFSLSRDKAEIAGARIKYHPGRANFASFSTKACMMTLLERRRLTLQK